MSHLSFINDSNWDFPFFKKLPANDTGESPGHQGGMVIPKDLRSYFPTLTGQTSSEKPTVDHGISAILIVDGRHVATVITRYQIQSWGGKRSPEARLTGNLGALRNEASANDFLIIQRSLENLELYRLILLRKGTDAFNEFSGLVENRRWGLVTKIAPVTQENLIISFEEESKRETKDFQLFETSPRLTESRSIRIARCIAFKVTLNEIYNRQCAVCRTGLISPNGAVEVEAAHIVPRSKSGSDDARNGLALCRRHHWAFDHGLFTVKDDYEIYVPSGIIRFRQNTPLKDINGKQLCKPANNNLMPDREALQWHRENVLIA